MHNPNDHADRHCPDAEADWAEWSTSGPGAGDWSPPQFNLMSILIIMFFCGVVFAAGWWNGASASFAVIVACLSVWLAIGCGRLVGLRAGREREPTVGRGNWYVGHFRQFGLIWGEGDIKWTWTSSLFFLAVVLLTLGGVVGFVLHLQGRLEPPPVRDVLPFLSPKF